MRIPTLMRALSVSGLVVGLACAHTCEAASAAWSPRSGGVPGHVWTRAGWIAIARPHTELVPAQPPRRHAAPPLAATARASAVGHCFSGQQTDQKSPSRDRAQLSRTLLARLGTTAMPDRRARSAALAALAGIFHEAHAPPSLS